MFWRASSSGVDMSEPLFYLPNARNSIGIARCGMELAALRFYEQPSA